MKKISKFLVTLFSISLLLTGCGASGSYESAAMDTVSSSISYDSKGDYGLAGGAMNYSMQAAPETFAEEEYVEFSDDLMMDAVEESIMEESKIENPKEEIQEVSVERKLIKTVNLSMQTKNFDSFIDSVEGIVNNYNGYIESSETDGIDFYSSYRHRNAYYVIRIPQNNLDSFLTNINDLGTINHKSENTEDVTLNYYDTQAQKKALEVEQERLMNILEKSETIEQIIALEQRLSEVRYEINSLGSNLRLLDNKVDYSTIYLDVNEVEVEIVPEKDKTVFETIAENWEQNLVDLRIFVEDLFINMTSNLSVIICEIILVVGIICICKGSKKRKQKRLEKKALKNEVKSFQKSKKEEIIDKEENKEE